jgi:outer membrane biogenesis lipoprotein LolB
MKKALVAFFALGACILITGCAADEPVPVENQASQAAAQESASKWTPEQKEKFAELNKAARGEGSEGKGVTGTETGK